MHIRFFFLLAAFLCLQFFNRIFAQCISLREIQNVQSMTLRQRDILFESKGLHLYDDSKVSKSESTGWRNSNGTTLIRLIPEENGEIGIEYQFSSIQCYEAAYSQIETSGARKLCDTTFPGMISYMWVSADGKKDIVLIKAVKNIDNKERKFYVMMFMNHHKNARCD